MADQSLKADIGFAELGLCETTLAAVAKAGYTDPTPIQAGLIPLALKGDDVVGQARTGSGKTAAFVLPILERVGPKKKSGGVEALILVPTRELAVQVHGEVQKLSDGRKVGCVAVYGGKPIRGQIDKLRRGAQIVVGTPGRVLDHISRATLELKDIKCVVLDEADRMLDIGFRPDIEKILRRCPQSRQTLLLSATVPPPIERIAQRYMHNPEKLDFSPGDVAVDTIEQFYFTVDRKLKFDLLVKLLEREEPAQAIVFCRTKRGTDKIQSRLSKKFKNTACMHGDMQQGARDRVMKAFREEKVKILVATDVVGRGIDVSGVSHIVNYDIPEFSDDYVHRVGRTGRMGRDGVAYTFVTPEEGGELTRIEIRIDKLLVRDEIPGFEAQPPVVKPESDQASAEGGKEEPAPDAPPAPPFGRRKKKYRRAL